eukprot:TRINITY_DN61317_c0_g1_i1.p1 TRINITY_DN61317_c0_g1~~TRINITY_DN61317_c0_g1_i1.p1  ORF type:complete len:221 (-),score=55.10 TRINITY_DN61317_c0_g1_i1:268-834(-)
MVDTIPYTPAMKVSEKTARKIMKEALGILMNSKAELDAAQQGKEAVTERVEAALPVLDKVMAGLVEKYKFQRGFSEVLESVAEVGQRSPKVKKALDKLTSYLKGEFSLAEAAYGQTEKLEATLAVVDQVCAGIAAKYSFTKGFHEALEAVTKISQQTGCPQLKLGLTQLGNILQGTGEDLADDDKDEM